MISNDTIIRIAKRLGFELVGFARADKLVNETNRLKDWIEKGFQSKMDYMERNLDKREDVSLILPGAKSVISLAMNYYMHGEYSNDKNFGKVSRYAWGRDYHFVIWEKLADMISELQIINSKFEAKSYVDTGPLMDKAWSVKAGIGWLGKHSNIISKEYGSWFFIANIITNFEFDYNEPIPDFCGTCTACIDACPTNAIVDNYVVDSNRCISYLTIENKKEIPGEFKGQFENWLFGCDTCQDVCPWNNKFSFEHDKEDFKPVENIELNLKGVDGLNNNQFKNRFHVSPISRARVKGLKRNAAFISE